MKTFQKSNLCIFLFCLLGTIILQSSKCKSDPVDPVVPAPVANFTASTSTIMIGESITFTDISTGNSALRQWEIPGGTPNSSIASTVTAKFTAEGNYTVKLSVSNTSGSSTKTLLVSVKPITFVHTVTAANKALYTTVIDNPATNGNPNAILIISCNYGTTTPYHNKPIAAFYNSANGGQWSIANEDISLMPIGVKFNVLVKNPSDKAFVAIPSKVEWSSAILNHPNLNGNPNAKFLITNRVDNSGVFNNSTLFTWYDGSQWRINNSNISNMPTTIRFNILIDDKIFPVQTTTNARNDFEIVHAPTDGKPNALLFGTHTQSPTGVGNVSQIGFYFNANANRWFVFNQSLVSMARDCRFMVWSNQE